MRMEARYWLGRKDAVRAWILTVPGMAPSRGLIWSQEASGVARNWRLAVSPVTFRSWVEESLPSTAWRSTWVRLRCKPGVAADAGCSGGVATGGDVTSRLTGMEIRLA